MSRAVRSASDSVGIRTTRSTSARSSPMTLAACCWIAFHSVRSSGSTWSHQCTMDSPQGEAPQLMNGERWFAIGGCSWLSGSGGVPCSPGFIFGGAVLLHECQDAGRNALGIVPFLDRGGMASDGCGNSTVHDSPGPVPRDEFAVCHTATVPFRHSTATRQVAIPRQSSGAGADFHLWTVSFRPSGRSLRSPPPRWRIRRRADAWSSRPASGPSIRA
ncbi:MAG: hypothetical protein JWM59_5091 [Verrucomicrobiales bacterium]|nr:hypothetical protein [Verrucomicrobiales bacterium]